MLSYVSFYDWNTELIINDIPFTASASLVSSFNSENFLDFCDSKFFACSDCFEVDGSDSKKKFEIYKFLYIYKYKRFFYVF